MSKLRAAGKRREEPARTNTGSSVRGKTISQPIPFPDDDEFPIRAPGTGIALPLDAEGIERLRASTPATNEPDKTSPPNGNAVSEFTPPREAPSPPHEAQIRRATQGHKPNQPSRLRNSVTSVPHSASTEKPQRKKTSMRSVFGRIFGKKQKISPTPSEVDRGSSIVRTEQHRSDPTPLHRTTQGPVTHQIRSTSLPIDEFNRALRSHSIVAEDLPFQHIETLQNIETLQHIEPSNDTNRDSTQEEDIQNRPRRATTPSRPWSPNRVPGYAQDFTGLSPRPASSHPRYSKLISDDEAKSAIDVAVTISSQPHRRSRSVSELQEAARANVVSRRRSDEIKYWRESYDPTGPLSPMSSNKAETEEPTPLEEEYPIEEETEEKPQPFSFGPMGEMAGMKITQAASLETKFQLLEDRMTRLERMVYRVGHDGPVQLQDPPKRNCRARDPPQPQPAIQTSDLSLPKHPRHSESQARGDLRGSRQGSRKRSSSYGSSLPSTVSTHTSPRPDFDAFPPVALLATGQPTARPISRSPTIRGIVSPPPTMPDNCPLTGEHFNALTNMILVEQAARLQLEAVVLSLQRQLQVVLSSSSTPQPPGSDSGAVRNPRRQRETTADGRHFSSSEQDDSSDDGPYDERPHPDDDDVFRTPTEERNPYGDEIFGAAAAVRSNADDGKTAPRTLSLSQITLGRGGVQPGLDH
ncbi:uncharacterized protein L3040_008989 [Drepanopeziza brunnea f. sp. 'multigermtubi']|uniref:Uncharacterized protein n=1 Tax=Marssonina brunnea f. sp. multigermtubi (strain MB_m1) TaxID=1072389 RepID=K1XH87_MARBU|nr:uncharacterized protein MBM_10003 [Drepanopeziza brunnea f. sp. 'multigermtubi' MB_m1]EKD11834.1 hypothetical protein MBM_10003 [Drepanopeziza brunnea f. sp. 'multigermtubi' MB_m1]KAJ5032384.1 hypothetical protein L3040_008989 [Drepanopeziza brunnea f. sp. 'multigermtubi']